MSKLKDHLVSLAAASDLEETQPGYSEVNTDLPTGTCKHHETRVDKNGNRYIVEDKDAYEECKRKFYAALVKSLEGRYNSKELEELFQRFKGYEGLTAPEKMVLFDKLRERKTRDKIAKQVKESPTMEEKISILEEFHREPKCERKITALRLKCMQGVREIRAKELKRNKRER